MKIRRHLMMQETDPTVDNPNKPQGYTIQIYKLRTVHGVWLNENAVEQLESLAETGGYDAVYNKLLDVLAAQIDVGSNVADEANPAESNYGAVRSCCEALPAILPTGTKKLAVDPPFLHKMIDGLDNWKDASDTELWLNFKLGLFFALCCPKKKDKKPPKKYTKLADEPKKIEKNASPLVDVACLLLQFERALDSVGIGQKEAVEMIKVSPGMSKRAAAYEFKMQSKENVGLPSFGSHSPVELVDRIRTLLGITCSSEEKTSTRRTIANLRSSSEAERDSISWAMLKLMMLDVTVHMTLTVIFPIVLIMLIGGYAQYLYAITTGAVADPISTYELFLTSEGFGEVSRGVFDHTVQFTDDSSGTYVGVRITLIISAVVAVFWVVRLMFSYSHPGSSMFSKLLRKMFGVALFGVVWVSKSK